LEALKYTISQNHLYIFVETGNSNADYAGGTGLQTISRETLLSHIFNRIGLENFQQAIDR
jgi:hypothetical protein